MYAGVPTKAPGTVIVPPPTPSGGRVASIAFATIELERLQRATALEAGTKRVDITPEAVAVDADLIDPASEHDLGAERLSEEPE